MKKDKSKKPLEGVRRVEKARMNAATMIHLRTEFLGWTQERLAQEMGVSQPLIQALENDRYPIPHSRAKHLKTLVRLVELERRIEAEKPADVGRYDDTDGVTEG